MKSLAYAIILLPLTIFMPSVLAQSRSAGGADKKAPVIAGEVERAGGQIQLVLSNPSDARAFQGEAKVSAGLSADAPIRLAITLAPNETRRFPLPSLTGSGAAGDQYLLAIYNQSGALVLYKIEPIKLAAESKREAALVRAPAPRKGSDELKVNARLTRGIVSKDAEIPTPDQVEPFLLTFDIESPRPVKDASFTLSAGDFQQNQTVSITGQTGQGQTGGRAALEFKLPETLGERKLSYALTSEPGQTLARGEVDLDQLTASDAVSVGALTFDRQAYTPGESARAVIELLGDGPRGYRLELTVKDGGGNVLHKDERRGSNTAGKSKQEFSVEIPREAQGPIIIAYQVFGGQTGALFDSGSREIVIKEAQEDKTKVAKQVSP